MIVIGVDVHKQSVTAVAIDDAGRMLDEKTAAAGSNELLGWAAGLGEERLWALEDCRRLTRWLERQLLSAGEQLVRVSPKLMAPARRAGRGRGNSDAIDALAVARAALREPALSGPRTDEEPYRELKLLVDHRDGIVDERRRVHQRLRWHLYQLDPTFAVPLRMLARKSHLERVSRWLARHDQELQVRIARDLVASCRRLDRTIAALDQELEQRTAELAPALLKLPGCGTITAAKLLAEIGPVERFANDAQLARHSGVAPLEAAPAGSNGTDSTAAATGNSTRRCTVSRSPRHASIPALAPTSNANALKARAGAKQSAASNASSSASSSKRSKRAPP